MFEIFLNFCCGLESEIKFRWGTVYEQSWQTIIAKSLFKQLDNKKQNWKADVMYV